MGIVGVGVAEAGAVDTGVGAGDVPGGAGDEEVYR